jgi:hypothetical protein
MKHRFMDEGAGCLLAWLTPDRSRAERASTHPSRLDHPDEERLIFCDTAESPKRLDEMRSDSSGS